MERRTFIGHIAGSVLAVLPLSAAAGMIPVVGVLNIASGPRSLTIDSARQGLRDLGYVEGETIAFDIRFAGGRPEAFPAFAADLVRRKVDVILASGPAAIRAAQQATSTIPIVALDLESDPVRAGFARSFARPGGNITGCFLDQPGLTGKWLELIDAVVPGARRIAVLRDPLTGPWQLEATKTAAERLGIELQVLAVRNFEELNPALERAGKLGSQALVQLSSPLFDISLAARIAEFAARRRLPAISMFRRFAQAGGLMSYGPNQSEFDKRLSVYIDKILKGQNPAELPIEQPTRYDFVINLKTAMALGLTIPQALRLQADLIE